MEPVIRRNDAARRFETRVEGTLCVLDYRLHDGMFSIDHVGVPSAVAGHGIAAALTKAAFDAARAANWRVVAHCTYAVAWIERNPEYADLVVHA